MFPYIDPKTVRTDVETLSPLIMAGVNLIPGAGGNVFLGILNQLASNKEFLDTVVNAINAFSGAKPPVNPT